MFVFLLFFGSQLPPAQEPVNLTEMRRFLRQMVRECPVEADVVDLNITIPAIPAVPAQEPEPADLATAPEVLPENAPALLDVDTSQMIPITHEEPLDAPSLPPEKPAETPPAETEKRPWGALTFTVFLLMLSISANVFLGWQLWEKRGRK
ncbi:MAG: hypothetical protein Q4D98_03880 [Planctomycetia bacterium]|nr:hypothetical protein [Planctomycetia bacterium]